MSYNRANGELDLTCPITPEVVMAELVSLRHGESIWNMENRFTGWTDVDLSCQGVEEARQAGRTLRVEGYEFDLCYTSVLKRAIRTLWLLSLIHISEPTRLGMTSYAVFCLKKKQIKANGMCWR